MDRVKKNDMVTSDVMRDLTLYLTNIPAHLHILPKWLQITTEQTHVTELQNIRFVQIVE
jgi:hypothetical protein